MFKTLWTPPVTGAYTILATFEGSNSYFASHGQTALGVSKASSAVVLTSPTSPTSISPTSTQTTTPAPTPVQTSLPSSSPAVQPPGNGTPMAAYIAIAALVIIIVVVAAALILRKRK